MLITTSLHTVEFPVSIGFVETSLQVLEGQSIDVCVELVVLQPPEIFPVEIFFDVDSLETTASSKNVIITYHDTI